MNIKTWKYRAVLGVVAIFALVFGIIACAGDDNN
jgi:hypothetical protein